jgi:rubrerythrin
MNSAPFPDAAIVQAIGKEREACFFYRMMSDLVSDPQLRERLASLADDEQLHAETLTRLHSELSDTPVGGCGPGQSEGRLGLLDLKSSSLHDVLEFALASEVGAISTYEGQAARSADHAARRIWMLLAEAERGHASSLRCELRKLETA